MKKENIGSYMVKHIIADFYEAHLSCTSSCAFCLRWLIPGGAAGHFLCLQTCDPEAAGRLYVGGHGKCGTARSAWCRGRRVWFSRAPRCPGCFNPLTPPSPAIPTTPHPLPSPPPPALLTALGPDYKISLLWSGLILERHNPRLRVTPTGSKHHNRPTYWSLRTQEFLVKHILNPAGVWVVSGWATKWLAVVQKTENY